MAGTAEVTAGEIARMAGVGRAAVSNWRKRYPDFPQPSGGTVGSPTFRLADVERWLVANERMPQQSGGEKLWLALQHSSAEPDREIPALLRTLLEIQQKPKRRVTTHAEAVDIAKKMGLKDALTALVDRFVDLRGRRGGATSPRVAGLMASLAAPNGKTVLDPACRSGALLAAAAAAGATTVYGQDPDVDNVTVANARLHFCGVRADLRQGSLGHDGYPDLLADAVISDPPTGGIWGYDELAADLRWEYSLPPRSEGELAWVQHALARLKPGGVAVLLLPPGVAERPAGRRVRRELLRRGALRALIALPSGTTAPYNMRLHLWVLRRPGNGQRSRDVLMVDADGTWEEAVATVTSAMAAYEDSQPLPGELAGQAAIVETVSLSSEDVDLTPSRLVASGRALWPAEAVIQRRDELLGFIGQLARSIPALRPASAEPAVAEISVSGLAKAGLASLHTGADVALRTGDVLVASIGPRPDVAVATPADEGHSLGPQRILIRPESDQLDPWFLAGFLGTEANLKRIVSTGSIPRVDVRKAQVPRLPVEVQQKYGGNFRRLREFDDTLRQAVSAGVEMSRMIAEGLTHGTLDSQP